MSTCLCPAARTAATSAGVSSSPPASASSAAPGMPARAPPFPVSRVHLLLAVQLRMNVRTLLEVGQRLLRRALAAQAHVLAPAELGALGRVLVEVSLLDRS